MSRVAKKPVELPKGVEVTISGQDVKVKGPKGELQWTIHNKVAVSQEDNVVLFQPNDNSVDAKALAGTSRSLVSNMVTGVDQGFEKTLQMVGVGYRAQVQGNNINLTLGFSHPVSYALPEGVTAEMPNNTTLILKSIDKQKLGQVAAEIRRFRPPEPYKGKGVRYADERILRKETKKK